MSIFRVDNSFGSIVNGGNIIIKSVRIWIFLIAGIQNIII
jgi:hypothetical protein